MFAYHIECLDRGCNFEYLIEDLGIYRRQHFRLLHISILLLHEDLYTIRIACTSNIKLNVLVDNTLPRFNIKLNILTGDTLPCSNTDLSILTENVHPCSNIKLIILIEVYYIVRKSDRLF